MAQAKVNGVQLEYETRGAGHPVLLIMGLGAQMTRWPLALIDKLVAAGRRVVWFDNRDVGLSEKFDSAGAPDIAAITAALQQGKKPPVAYTLDAMAGDAVGLLDALAIDRAHIVGASMGGMIAQLVAADYPDRTLSLTSIMSTTGNPELPRATPEAMAVIANRGPDPNTDFAAFLDHAVRSARVLSGPGFPFDERQARVNAEAAFKRSFHPVGFQRQYAAILASPERRAKLRTVKAPTVVVHGDADPLVPLAGGRDTADNVPRAELRVITGMGHDLPAGALDLVAAGIERAIARAHETV